MLMNITYFLNGICKYSFVMEMQVARCGAVIEALRYKPEGHEIDSRWCHCNSGLTMALGSTHPLTEMGTRNIFLGVKAADA
jgi:hypothetical protein